MGLVANIKKMYRNRDGHVHVLAAVLASLSICFTALLWVRSWPRCRLNFSSKWTLPAFLFRQGLSGQALAIQ
jgi:hypothetical protein